MVKIALVNSDTDEIISRYVFEEDEFFKSTNAINTSQTDYDKYIQLFNELDYTVDILEPYNDGEDFIIRKPAILNQYLKDYSNANDFKLENRLFKESFPIFYEMNFFKTIQEVYKNEKSISFRLLEYIGKSVDHSITHRIIKLDDCIFLLSHFETSFDLSYHQDLFDNENPMIIAKDGKIVKRNIAFLEIIQKYHGKENANLRIQELNIKNLVDDEYFSCENRTKEEWAEAYRKINDREIYSDTSIMKERLPDNKNAYFEVTMIPITLKNSPAVQISVKDISERVYKEIEAQNLKEDIGVFEDINKIAIMHYDPIHKYRWTNGIYEIIEEPIGSIGPEVNIINQYLIKDKEERERISSLIKKAKAKKSFFKTRTKFETKKGTKTIIISLHYTKTDEYNNQITVGYIQDVSEMIENEIKAEEAKNQLAEVYKLHREHAANREELYNDIIQLIIQNIQNTISFTNLEQRFNKNNPEIVIENTIFRNHRIIKAFSSISKSKDLKHIPLNEYLKEEVQGILNDKQASNIHSEFNLKTVNITINKVIPVGLIMSELIMRTIEEGSNDKTNLKVDLFKEGDYITIRYSDDSTDLDKDFDIDSSLELRWVIIQTLKKQINGTIKQIPYDGTCIELSFME